MATDGSRSAASAARAVAEISGKTGAELHAVYVEPSVLGRDPSLTIIMSFSASLEAAEETYELNQQDALETLRAGVQQVEKAGGEVTKAHLRVGHPAKEVVALSKELEADLVVVGRRRLGRLRRMVVGSVSEKVVRNLCEAAVLVVPPG